MKIKVSEKLNSLAIGFGEEAPLFLVGGYVRNHIARLPCSDVDICGCLELDAVAKILPQGYEMKVKNRELNTCEIVCGSEIYEYATFRKEVYKNGGVHTPFQITFDATIVEDVSRRDFTCNSLYYEIIKDKLIDFYGGEQDIKAKKLKTVETPDFVLKNDGVRILRMIRFASELNFSIDDETYAAAENYKTNLAKISKERIRQEFTKIVNASKTYSKYDRKSLFNRNRGYNGIKLIDKLDLWRYFSSSEKVTALRGVGAYLKCFIKEKQDPERAFFVDAYNHLKRLNIIADVKEFEEIVLGVKGLNYPKVMRKKFVEIITLLQKAEDIKDKPLASKLSFVSAMGEQKESVLNYLKASGSRQYNYVKTLIKNIKGE